MIESEEFLKALDANDARNHARNIIIASIAGLPIIGGPLSSLLSDYLPDWKQERIVQFLNDLAESLNDLEKDVNENYINSEEFAYLFEQTFLGVVKNYQEEKLLAYKSILINSCRNDELSTSRKEYFLSIAEDLEPIHFQILSLFFDTESFSARHNVELPQNLMTGSLRNTVMTMLRPFSYEEDMVTSAISELDNYRFFNNLAGSLRGMMSAGGAIQLRGRLTDFGREFCNFVISEF